jgi:hypothetical protein
MWCPRPSLTDQTHTSNTTTSAILTPSRRKNYVPASPGYYRQMEHTCMPIAPSGALLPTDIGCGALLSLAPRPHTATPAACDSNLDSGNHDMSRLSAFACLNDAPIHALPIYLYACSQRILGVSPLPLAPRPDTHNTTTSAKLALSRPKSYLRAAPVEFGHSTCIRLTAASFRPLFLTDLGAAPSPLAPRPDPHD